MSVRLESRTENLKIEIRKSQTLLENVVFSIVSRTIYIYICRSIYSCIPDGMQEPIREYRYSSTLS